MIRHAARAGIFPALLLGAPLWAEPRLAMPLDCTLGVDCFVQNYVDRDPGPGAQDFTCGGLSYDGHKGTDFALTSLAAMQAGVTVRAAAGGVVKAMRDGMADTPYTTDADDRVGERACGNGVVLLHADGWETQYCHIKQGSVRVREGQLVETGDELGKVGLSGRTAFPHLHVSVRHDGTLVDPFTPDAALDSCRGGDARTMWRDDVAYRPGGLIAAGFAAEVPAYDAIKAGEVAAPARADSPAIILWGYAFGGRQADVLQLEIAGPQGRVYKSRLLIRKDAAQFYRAGGKRLKAPLPPGTYTGIVTLIRDGSTLSQRIVTTDLR